MVSTAWSVNELPADQLDTMHCTERPDRLCLHFGWFPRDGLTLSPWKMGQALSWDVTVVWPLAESRVEAEAQEAGAVAQTAPECKATKCAELEGRYLFQPIAVESQDPINDSATSFLNDLGRRIADVSGEIQEGRLLFQQLSVLI